MARRHTRQDGPGTFRFSHNALARHYRGKCSGGRNAERSHGLADDILAQDGTQRRSPISAPGKRRRTRALELNIAAHAVQVDHFAEQNRPPVAKLRDELTELVSSVRHCNRLGAIRDPLTAKDFNALRRGERARI